MCLKLNTEPITSADEFVRFYRKDPHKRVQFFITSCGVKWYRTDRCIDFVRDWLRGDWKLKIEDDDIRAAWLGFGVEGAHYFEIR